MSLIADLLRRNTSAARLAGFAVSNFIGILIVAGAVMFWLDSRPVLTDDDGVLNSDFIVLNKRVTSASTLGDRLSTRFSQADIAELEAQPWVRRIGRFNASDFRVYASVATGGGGLETALFFESVPDEFVDIDGADWHFNEGDVSVPVIVSKDYLALYNFGFAGSAGLPQLSEQLISGIPLDLFLRSDDGSRSMRIKGRIAGFSNRLNTVLVPDSFMRFANDRLGSGNPLPPSRLIVDVSSPGDVAIDDYLKENALEVAGDKSGSSAAYLLKVVLAIVVAVGSLITLLSFFVLMLSVSLLMEKNRIVIHRLLVLGTPLGDVAAPYSRMIVAGCVAAWLLAMVALWLLRSIYIGAVEGFGADWSGFFYAVAVGSLLTVLIVVVNICAVRRKVVRAWGLKIVDA